jgi:hypothetical protein
VISTNKFTGLRSNYFGFLFGITLVVSQINIVYGLPFALFFLLVFSNKISLNKNDRKLFVLIVLELLWFLFMYIFFPVNFTHWIRHVAFFLIIFTVILTKVDWNFIHGICISMIVLLLLDFSFNLISSYTGMDPFGRAVTIRTGDMLPRLGGVFGHAFFSLNISFMGFLSAYIKRNNIVMILSIINISLTGTYRAIILLFVLLIAFYFIKKGISFLKIKIYSLLFAFSVFAVTVYSVTLNFSQSNVFRVFAWTNSLNNIANNPYFGSQDFYTDEMEFVSLENIENYGIAESTYLEIAVHYGVFPMIIFLMIMILLLRKSYDNFTSSNKIILISTVIIFTDTFYGSIYGMPLTTIFFTLLIFSTNKKLMQRHEPGLVIK